MANIAMIPADNQGNKLFIKDFRVDEEKGRYYIKYKSTFNDIPFKEVDLNIIDEGKVATINGDDGTVLYRFSTYFIGQIIQENESTTTTED